MIRDSRNEAALWGYKEIADRLQSLIRTGQYLPGSLLPTERELQSEYGVSRGTVRRALQALIDSGWAASSPNRGVVSRIGPNSNRKNVIAFVDHVGSVHQYLFFRLSGLLSEHGLHLVHVDSLSEGTEGALEYSASQHFAAAVVWSKTNTPDCSRIHRVQQVLPVIAVDHALRTVETDVVAGETYSGAQQAVSHLASLGYRHIAITGMLDTLDTTQDRLGGYMQGLFDSGLQPEIRNFLFCHTSGPSPIDTNLLEYRLKSDDRPDAIFLMQDSLVHSVVDAIDRCGLNIPDDIALVGFGNDEPVTIGSVGLTTLAFDWDSIASSITERILIRLGNPSAPTTRVTVSAQLVVRGSCGASKEAWSSIPYQRSSTAAIHSMPDVPAHQVTSYRFAGTSKQSSNISTLR